MPGCSRQRPLSRVSSAGDTIAVFGVHEATLGAAPLYLGHLPAVTGDVPLRVKMEAHATQIKVRKKTRAVFE